MKKTAYIKPEVEVTTILMEALLDTASLPTDNDNELEGDGDFLGNKGGSLWDED